jgi:hypothetical protein
MDYHGTIRSGLVILEDGAGLPDGTRVRVTPVDAPPGLADPQDAAAPGGTLGARLMRFAGRARGLPSDSARNHDHYLYGTPRR